MEERVRRKGKRDWRFFRLEKTSFPKTESPLDSKLLKKKNEKRKTMTISKKKEQNKNETNHKQ